MIDRQPGAAAAATFEDWRGFQRIAKKKWFLISNHFS
jgi:hypothetical protein